MTSFGHDPKLDIDLLDYHSRRVHLHVDLVSGYPPPSRDMEGDRRATDWTKRCLGMDLNHASYSVLPLRDLVERDSRDRQWRRDFHSKNLGSSVGANRA